MSFEQDPNIQKAAGDIGKDAPEIAADIKSGNVDASVGAIEKGYEELSALAPGVVQESKSGYKTTEFWLVIAYEILTQSGAIHLPGTWGKLAAGAAGIVAYALSRGIAKAGTPYISKKI